MKAWRDIILSVLLVLPAVLTQQQKEDVSSCSTTTTTTTTTLQRMEYNVGDGPQETRVYIEPPVETFYRNTTSLLQQQVPSAFRGRHCKFFNLLNVPLALYWEDGKTEKSLVKVLRPLSTAGITAFIGTVFAFRFLENDAVLERFQISEKGSNVFSIDPSMIDRMREHYGLKNFSSSELESYTWLTKTLTFNDYYQKFTGRSFLSRYGKLPPKHFMWPADFFGQQHHVSRNETRWSGPLPQGHVISGPCNMTLTVLSCAPRVFEIHDFLSVAEVQHLVELAERKELVRSKTGQGDGEYASKGTRSSQNSWIWPNESPVVQAIYRRAYDLLQLNHDEDVAEPLQILRYRASEAYKVHSDFGYPDPSHPRQPTRFATLLLYLNHVTLGGETSFPLWSNTETSGDLKVIPEMGKAVLFYSQNEDGNMDEKSLHEALPVMEGEKWLANLWFWEPVKDVASLQ